jgi:hypothetical protein
MEWVYGICPAIGFYIPCSQDFYSTLNKFSTDNPMLFDASRDMSPLLTKRITNIILQKEIAKLDA